MSPVTTKSAYLDNAKMRSMGLCQNGRDRHFGLCEGAGGRGATADYAPWDCLFRKVWQCVGANKGIE